MSGADSILEIFVKNYFVVVSRYMKFLENSSIMIQGGDNNFCRLSPVLFFFTFSRKLNKIGHTFNGIFKQLFLECSKAFPISRKFLVQNLQILFNSIL